MRTSASDEPSVTELLGLAKELAHAAGEVLLAARSGRDAFAATRASASVKSSATDLATDADRASEALVRRELARRRPKDAVLGEEGGASEGDSGLLWLVDPLDGTTNFVYDYPAWCVSIAVARHIRGTIVSTLAGVVHDPLRGETFAATAGGGSTRDGADLLHSGATVLGEALVGTGFGYAPARRAEQADVLRAMLPVARDIRRSGSAALDLCAVACGRLDAYYESGLRPWDRAAGLLIASEAGARSTEVFHRAVTESSPADPEPLRDDGARPWDASPFRADTDDPTLAVAAPGIAAAFFELLEAASR